MTSNTNCLYIDDDRDDHLIFSLALTQASPGAQCFFTTDCIKAIELIKSGTLPLLDFIFMDWLMPGPTAPECLTDLTMHSRPQAPVIVIITGMPGLIDPKLLAEFGASFILQKQHSIELLSQQLLTILNLDRK